MKQGKFKNSVLINRIQLCPEESQSDFAERIGINQPNLSDIERGLHRVTYKTALNIVVNGLRLSADYLGDIFPDESIY